MRKDDYPKFAGKWKASEPLKDIPATLVREPYDPGCEPGRRREQPTRPTAMMGQTPKVDSPQYTGTKMLGTAGMHKSNTVPVFSEAEANEIAHMRR